MNFILYSLVAFIVFFFTYKTYYPKAEKWAEESRYRDISESKYFWMAILIPPFWIITIPMLVLWKILETIYNKIKQ